MYVYLYLTHVETHKSLTITSVLKDRPAQTLSPQRVSLRNCLDMAGHLSPDF